VEPAISALGAAKRAEREREQSVERERREGPRGRELPPELPDPDIIGAHSGRGNEVRPGRIRRGQVLNPNAMPPELPEPDEPNPKMIGAHRGRGNMVRPGPIRQLRGTNTPESFEAVVRNMKKLYEEAAEALAGEAEARGFDLDNPAETPVEDGQDGGGEDQITLLGDIRDLLKELLAVNGGSELAGGDEDGFKLPDNATPVDLTSGEAEGEPDAIDELPLPSEGDEGEDLTNNDGRVDAAAEDEEGVEGEEDDEDDPE
jgi:hypothetical protein